METGRVSGRGTAVPDVPSGPGQVRSWSVRTYLLLIVAVAVAAVTAATGYGFAWSSGQARHDATSEMRLQARRAAASLASSVAGARKTVQELAAQPGLAQVFAAPRDCQLSADSAGAFASVRLDIVSRAGKVACSSAPSRRLSSSPVHAGSPWLAAALRSRGPAIDWGSSDAATHTPAVVLTAPVMSGRRAVGAVALFLHVPQIAPALAHTVAGTKHESFTIVDRGTHAVLSASETVEDGAPPAIGMRFPDASTTGDWAGVDGSRRLFSSGDVAGAPWRVYAGERRSTALADARGALSRQVLVGLLALLVLAVAVLILNRRVAGPLGAVTRAVARASRAPEGARVDEAGPAELRALARQFNAMLDVRAGHNAQLVHQATHDPMTGLPNKILLRERLDDALRRDGADGRIGVLWIGIGGLDIVNDGFGHEVGDRISVEVSTRLSSALRSGDSLARFSSHEFVVLCRTASSEEVVDVAVRLQRCFEQPFRGPGGEILLQSSIGIARSRETGTSADQLLREADTAMREAKAIGQGSYEFDGALQQRATRHLAVHREIAHALQRHEFLVYYQPLVEVDTGRILGTEALVRWQHPERGLVAPMEFIPIAEETGQIAAIGQLVLRHACAQAAAWAAAGHPLRMSVNVAVEQLRDETFPATVAQVLSETGLDPAQLCLEITESSLAREFEQGASALARLRQLGVHLAVDDFGTGYSSLSYLHDLPVDELKVDRSFIGRLGAGSVDDRDRHLVEAVVGMARALGLSVVAEGVETEQQLEFLAGLGCPIAQGYLFAPPQPADQLLALMQAQGRPALV